MRNACETLMPSARHARSVLRALFIDFARSLPSYSHWECDLNYLLSRFDKEGNQFLFMTLPLLGKAIEKALISNEALQTPLGWRLHKGTRLPLLCFQCFKTLFTDEGHHLFCNGFEPTNEARVSVFYLRQIFLLYSKVETSHNSAQELEAVKGFKDRSTHQWHPDFSNENLRDTLRLSRELLNRVFGGTSPTLTRLHRFRKDPWGRHGPGAVSGSEHGREKWDHLWWPGLPTELFMWAPGSAIPGGFPLKVQPSARVVTVPKDFRGPRVICVEPKENQFAQQGLMELLYAHLQEHFLTRSSIQFEDVHPSRCLCFDRNVTTIDLKDASDTVSLRLARLILPEWIFELVTRYRTRSVTFDGDTWNTTCLASMGNATCFPLETLIFWVIARSTMFLIRNSWPRHKRRSLNTTLRVFGDDIIVPSWAGDSVMDSLTACGLIVNNTKTCHLSPVKESCGEWTYHSQSSCIVKCKSAAVTDHRSWLQFREYISQFTKLGCFATAASMSDLCEAQYPVSRFKTRYNGLLQRMEIRVPQFVMAGRTSELDGYAGLYAWHVRNNVIPFLRGTRKLVKWRWVSKETFL